MDTKLAGWCLAAATIFSPAWADTPVVAWRLADPAPVAKPDYVKAAATLANGDVVMTLIQSDTIVVDGQGSTLAGRGSDGGVIVYDQRTGAAKTRFSFGGDAMRVVPHGIAVDSDGAFVVIGYAGTNTAGSVDFGGGPVAFSAAEAPFVARYDAGGRHLWSHLLQGDGGSKPGGCGGANCDRAWDVALAPDGRIAVVGGFSGTLKLPQGELASRGDTDAFVLVLDRAGRQLAAWGIGGPGVDGGRQGAPASPGGLGEMAVAFNRGQLVVQGVFGRDTEFGGTGASQRLSPGNGARDVFIARYSAEGRLQGEVWAAGLPRDTPGAFAAPGALRADATGNLYFSGRLPTGGRAWNGCAATPQRGERILAVSFDADLRCRWVTVFDFDGGGVHRIQPDGRGNVYLAGWFSGAHAFPNQRLAARSTRSDVFVARLRADGGQPAWGSGLVSIDAMPAGNIPAALAIDGAGHVWVGGQFFTAVEAAQRGQASLVLRTVAGGPPTMRGSDGFVVRFEGETGLLR